MPRSTPIDTKQTSPRSLIIDFKYGYDNLPNYSTVAKNLVYTKWLKLKEASGFLVISHLVEGNLHMMAAPYFLILFTLSSCIKKIVQYSGYVGLLEHSSTQY